MRLRVTARAESVVRSGHPWIFAESMRSQNRAGQTGELVVVYDRNDRFLALGLLDQESAIRVRVVHCGKPRVVDSEFWLQKLEQSFNVRAGLFDDRTTGFRWVHGESDGWPGLVLDRYDKALVLKLYTAAWVPWLNELTGLIVHRLQPQRIVLRLSRNISQSTAERFGKHDGQILWGQDVAGPVPFLETGLRFQADIVRGQKTGFFLDQRENRRRIEALARGQTVLNAFSFSGGFSLYSARGGAVAVTDLDMSPHALAAAELNFSLNQAEPAIQACRTERIQADAFEWLAANPRRRFGVVVLDPPSMARRQSERAGALAAYFKLAALGVTHLARRGILLACSCSAHVSEAEFFEVVRQAAFKSQRPFHEIARATEPPDHPAVFPETRYLKAIYLQFDSV